MIGAVRAVLRKEALRRAMARALRERLAARVEEATRPQAYGASASAGSGVSRKFNESGMAGDAVTAYYEMYPV